jgi:hypothetical protein
VQRVPFAIGSPYLISHRLYGRSLADLLMEVQRIQTALTRALLDSAYFALNQRYEVATASGRANDFTISDLLRNEPGVPVRSNDGNSVRPLQPATLGFDAYGALEYFATVGEQRTGIVRNAQGLNPDTLHDTAAGAAALMSAAQKRTRMIARVLAETCVKELFLGVHALIRENATAARTLKLRGKWTAVDPSQWAERLAMTIEVGLGASGRDAEIAALNQLSGVMRTIVEEQGGAQGPLVTLQNVYNAATRLASKLGFKTPELFFTDPNSPQAQQAIQAAAGKPDPELAKVQGDHALQQQKQQGEWQTAQMKVQSQQQIAAAKAQGEAAVSRQANQLEHERLVAQQQGEMALEQARIASAERIAIAVARINAEARIAAAEAAAQPGDGSQPLAFEEQHETATT